MTISDEKMAQTQYPLKSFHNETGDETPITTLVEEYVNGLLSAREQAGEELKEIREKFPEWGFLLAYHLTGEMVIEDNLKTEIVDILIDGLNRAENDQLSDRFRCVASVTGRFLGGYSMWMKKEEALKVGENALGINTEKLDNTGLEWRVKIENDIDGIKKQENI